jgi:hypothetical protein
MTQSNKTLREFCDRHRVNVVDTNKRAYRYTRMNTKMFQFSDDYNKFICEDMALETETLYTVEVTESELTRIADFEDQVFNNMKQTGHYRMFEVLMEQKERERQLRDAYPAVKKAYEHYSLMLKLAETGDI